ncbi:MAG: DoxX family protein [Ginsengibacter sp.]
MYKLFSTRVNNGAFNTGMLILRLALGGLMLHHGYDKMVHFNEMKGSFMNFLHLGTTITLSLVIFAELFCAALIVIGLFTRIASFVLLFNMAVIVFMVMNKDIFGKAEISTLYLAGYLVLIICGAGKVSIDNMISK